jgi:hypothetical protein
VMKGGAEIFDEAVLAAGDGAETLERGHVRWNDTSSKGFFTTKTRRHEEKNS